MIWAFKNLSTNKEYVRMFMCFLWGILSKITGQRNYGNVLDVFNLCSSERDIYKYIPLSFTNHQKDKRNSVLYFPCRPQVNMDVKLHGPSACVLPLTMISHSCDFLEEKERSETQTQRVSVVLLCTQAHTPRLSGRHRVWSECWVCCVVLGRLLDTIRRDLPTGTSISTPPHLLNQQPITAESV